MTDEEIWWLRFVLPLAEISSVKVVHKVKFHREGNVFRVEQ
jgi:hypothetical protein